MFKKVLKITTLTVALLLAAVVSVKAITDTVAISDLPGYLNTDTFKLSYSALSDSSVTAQFYVRKDTNPTWIAFGGIQTGASGQIQATGTQINDGDGLYRFKVQINGGTAGDETTTTIDRSGPSPVQNYWKEQVAGGFYRLHWKNPGDDDLSRVFIYRSTETQFTADGLTKVGELGGGPDNEMTWDNVGLDSSKTYYYALRAVDKAGNASGIVSDPETQVTVLEAATQIPAEEEVITLPREEEGGQVLGEEEKVIETEEGVSGEAVDSLEEVAGVVTTGRRRIIWFVATVFVFGLVYYFFRRRKRR
jgi:hypothetical protein